jgi:hypothetical protein
MRKAEHNSPGTHNPVALAYENLISQLTTDYSFIRLASNDTLIDI